MAKEPSTFRINEKDSVKGELDTFAFEIDS